MKYLFLTLGVVNLVIAGELTISSSSDCGNEYIMDANSYYYFKYQGNPLELDKCITEFSVDTNSDEMICYKPTAIRMDCDTVIEFQEHFVADSIHDGRIMCNMNSVRKFNETCLEYVSHFFIVIKKERPYETAYEQNVIHVYTKEKPSFDFDKDDSASDTLIIIACVLPVALIFICVIACGIKIWRQEQQSRGTQVTYNTAMCATNVQTGPASRQPMLPYSGNQQTSAPGYQYPGQQPLDGYHVHVHPTVTAYPAPQSQPASGPYTYQPVPSSQDRGMPVSPPANPSAPPHEDFMAPPPSYETLMKK